MSYPCGEQDSRKHALTHLALIAILGASLLLASTAPAQALEEGNGTIKSSESGRSAAAETATTPPPPGVLETTSDLRSAQWHLGAANAYSPGQTATGQGITVALIDSGIEPSTGRDEFAGRILDGARWNDGRLEEVASADMTDSQGHGTHVGGIIGASNDGQGISGIAPEVKLLPIDVSRAGDEEDFTLALIYALEFARERGAAVANISAGFSDAYIDTKDYAERLCETVQEVTDGGMVVVASAGNDGSETNVPIWPAGCNAALTVAALTPTQEPTYWSSFDYNVDVSAPGQDILSTVPATSMLMGNAGLGYAFASGTSMSAPIVSGVAALLRQQHPQWSAHEIIERITSTATDIGAPGKDTLTGYGAVNIGNALGLDGQTQARAPWITFGVRTEFASGTTCVIDCLYVNWKPYSLDPESIELTIYSTEHGPKVHTYSGVVRANLTGVGKDAWVSLTATYPGGYRIALPARPVSDDWNWPEPPKDPMSLNISRNADHSVTLTWTSDLTERISNGRIDLTAYMPSMASISSKIVGKIHIPPGSPAQGTLTVKLPKRAHGLELHAQAHLTLENGQKLYPHGLNSAPSNHPISVIAERIGKGWVIEARLHDEIYSEIESQCRQNYTACRGLSAALQTKKAKLEATLHYGALSYASTEQKLPKTVRLLFRSLDGALPPALKRPLKAPVYLVSSPTFTRQIQRVE